MAQDEPVEIKTDDARAGSTPHILRYMLAISTILVIVFFGYIWLVD